MIPIITEKIKSDLIFLLKVGLEGSEFVRGKSNYGNSDHNCLKVDQNIKNFKKYIKYLEGES